MSAAEAQDILDVTEDAFEFRRQLFGEDLCDLIGPTFADGGAGGDSVSLAPIPGATNLECFVEELAPAAAQTVIGGETYTSSHRIELKRSAATDAITPRYRIKVLARDGKPIRFFENPVIPAESFTPLVIIKASLVRQGYQQ